MEKRRSKVNFMKVPRDRDGMGTKNENSEYMTRLISINKKPVKSTSWILEYNKIKNREEKKQSITLGYKNNMNC